jgi:hypothetical protein
MKYGREGTSYFYHGKMKTEMIPEKWVIFNQLTWLIAREDCASHKAYLVSWGSEQLEIEFCVYFLSSIYIIEIFEKYLSINITKNL